MCVVSMVMDHYSDMWQWRLTHPSPSYTFIPNEPGVSPKEIEEFRQLLDRARKYDKQYNEPDCELDEKREKVKALAKQLGIEDQINFI